MLLLFQISIIIFFLQANYLYLNTIKKKTSQKQICEVFYFKQRIENQAQAKF